MTGISRHTGATIDNFESALQGVEVALTTKLATRVMRRQFCGGVAELLGRALTPQTLAAFKQIVATAIDLWEPRFLVRRVLVNGSVDQLRTGQAGFVFEVDYRPRGHLGDFTVERVVSFSLKFRSGQAHVLA